MKKIIYLLLLSISVTTFNSCSEEIETSDLKFVSFEKTSVEFEAELDVETSIEFSAFTTNTSSSDQTFDVQVLEGSTADPAFYTVDSSVTIPAGTNEGKIMISVTDGAWLFQKETILVRLMSKDGYSAGEVMEVKVAKKCQGSKIRMSLTFDTYPEELAWRILDANTGDTLAASANPFAYGAYDGFAGNFVTDAECLVNGDYVLQIYDQYRDGGTAFEVYIDGELLFTVGATDYTGPVSIPFTI